MGNKVKFDEMDVCGLCGSGDVRCTGLVNGTAGIVLSFECNDCGCEFVQFYEYSCKGIVQDEEV